METVSKSAQKEIIGALRTRYQQSSKSEKGMILSEFTAVTGFHRKHAIRLLNAAEESLVKKSIENSMQSQRIYDEAVKAVLIVLWEAADRICGKRLKAAIPTLMGAMERHGHLSLDPEIRQKVVAVSAATIDRVLTPVRQSAGSPTTMTAPACRVIMAYGSWACFAASPTVCLSSGVPANVVQPTSPPPTSKP